MPSRAQHVFTTAHLHREPIDRAADTSLVKVGHRPNDVRHVGNDVEAGSPFGIDETHLPVLW